jgi:hypothetical protein
MPLLVGCDKLALGEGRHTTMFSLVCLRSLHSLVTPYEYDQAEWNAIAQQEPRRGQRNSNLKNALTPRFTAC